MPNSSQLSNQKTLSLQVRFSVVEQANWLLNKRHAQILRSTKDSGIVDAAGWGRDEFDAAS